MNGIVFAFVNLRNSFSLDSARTWLLLVATITLVGITYLGQATEATVTGQRVHDLQDRLDRIERQNAQLEFEVASLLAPDKLETRAKALGLRPVVNSQLRFESARDYASEVSLLASASSITRSASTVEPKAPSSWWDDLVVRLHTLFSPTVEATPSR